MIYKLHTSLDIDTCQEKLSNTLISDFSYMLWGGMGYCGDVDEFDKSFWILNKMDFYRTGKGGYKFYSTRKLVGQLFKSREGTRIVCEFKVLTIYKVFWGLWYFLLSLLFLFCTYNLLVEYMVHDKFQHPLAITSLGIILFGILGWFIIRYNLNKSSKVEEDTIEFLEGLLETGKAKCDEYY